MIILEQSARLKRKFHVKKDNGYGLFFSFFFPKLKTNGNSFNKKFKSNDGPFVISKILPNHEILRDVKSFDGGKYANRSEIKLRIPKEFEKIDLVAEWYDVPKTPMIICKRGTFLDEG